MRYFTFKNRYTYHCTFEDEVFLHENATRGFTKDWVSSTNIDLHFLILSVGSSFFEISMQVQLLSGNHNNYLNIVNKMVNAPVNAD